MNTATDQSDSDDALLAYLTARTGLVLRGARYRDVIAGLARVKRKFGIIDADQFVDRLRVDTSVFDAVISEITIGETYFLRELAQLDAVRRVVLPALVARRPKEACLRLWSAGCATGEEAYSLAMILEEEGLVHRASILATDISAAALTRARRAEYGQWSMRNDPHGQLARYFTASGKSFKLVDRLRKQVKFEPLNLASDVWPSPFSRTDRLDLILCRNVLIYFGKDFVRQVGERLYASLADGGWLITGPSDPPLWQHAPFSTVIVSGAVLYRRESAAIAGLASPAAPPVLQSSPVMKAADPDRAVVSLRPTVIKATPHPKSAEGPQDAEAWTQRVEQLSAADLGQAERSAAEAIARHPLSIELHYLRAVLLVALDRHEEAIVALGRLLYLDRSLAAVHLTLGTLLQRRGDLKAARRSLEMAYRLCAVRPANEEVPLCEGGTAGEIAEGAKAQIARLKKSN